MKLELKELRQAFHKIPEPGFHEFQTKQLIEDVIASFPQEHLEIVHWRTGLIVKVTGTEPTQTIGWRTDIDGLPITEQTGVPFVSERPGFMHACGHDVHITIALGLLGALSAQPAKQHVVIYFQPAEESPGGALPMREWVKANRPDLLPDAFYALHVAPELPVGTISTKPGILFANTSELYIDLHGVEGHAAFPHQTTDMSVAVAHLLIQLQSIVSRSIDPLEPSVVTIGKMTSGTVQNIISGHARLEGTIRTMNAEVMTRIKKRIEAIVAGVEQAFECEATIDYGSSYHQVFNTPELAEAFQAFTEVDGELDFVVAKEAMTGEDFGYFLQEVPGVLFWAGAASDYGLHNAKMLPNEAMLEPIAAFLERFFRSQ
ncbi:N-acetyldiaminopimelate deacetylase [Chryseomicrobium palamuruense]|uniref:N-acetyldiaminopimelate deacetylase n=1 Tax=Chryseomicrobium palamuruense TaxID=682973 RepID=A0ABV8UUA6_9BACL